ncbi:MAG: tripartite tricarboxylate transporter substrate binding protein [Burkholderiales bacterium]
MRLARLALFTLCSIGAVSAAIAQSYPSKPIRFVVGFAPGGGTDFVARVIGKRLSETLGQQIVVDNRPGAGGMVANEHMAKAVADGYSILVGAAGPLVIAPNLYDKVNFDTQKDFEPIALIASSPFVLIIHPSVPAKSLSDLIAYAKANPGKLNYGSSGNGGAPHLAGELFTSMAGVNMVHVPYKGLAPAITDALSGQVQAVFADVGLVLAHLQSGGLRALAVTGNTRSASLPDVPTVAEGGLAGYKAETWYGLLGPAGTPPAVIARLNAEVAKALAFPDVRNQFKTQGLDAAPSTPAQYALLIAEDLAKWAKLIKDAKIRPN